MNKEVRNEFFDLAEIVYEEQFEKMYNFTKVGLTGNHEKDEAAIQVTLKTLLADQANDWIGRGEIYLARSNANIAALEQIRVEILKKDE